MRYEPVIAEYDGAAHKLLCDNRRIYIAMSAMTVNGRVPSFREVRDRLAKSVIKSPKGASNEASP